MSRKAKRALMEFPSAPFFLSTYAYKFNFLPCSFEAGGVPAFAESLVAGAGAEAAALGFEATVFSSFFTSFAGACGAAAGALATGVDLIASVMFLPFGIVNLTTHYE